MGIYRTLIYQMFLENMQVVERTKSFGGTRTLSSGWGEVYSPVTLEPIQVSERVPVCSSCSTVSLDSEVKRRDVLPQLPRMTASSHNLYWCIIFRSVS